MLVLTEPMALLDHRDPQGRMAMMEHRDHRDPQGRMALMALMVQMVLLGLRDLPEPMGLTGHRDPQELMVLTVLTELSDHRGHRD
jgi:hypothetical protein